MNLLELNSHLPPGFKVIGPSQELEREVWSKLSKAKSAWFQEVFPSSRALMRELCAAVLIIKTPWGLFYFDEYFPRWRVCVHGLFWSSDVMRHLGDVEIAGHLARHFLEVPRLECPVLGKARGVERLLRSVGFEFEGRHRRGARNLSGLIVDKAVYAIVE